MKLIKEFKEFVSKGNVLDMAFGVIIGGAFGKIVTSLVNDMVMPPIGKLLGGVNFVDLFISLDPEKTQGIASLTKAKETGAAIIAYGHFLNTIIDFLIIAASIFLTIKIITRFNRKKAETPTPATTKECPFAFQQFH